MQEDHGFSAWLWDVDRLVVRVRWQPLQSDRFQPTNFPNLGAAEYVRPGGKSDTRVVVVESPQSMTNRLESLSWDTLRESPTGPFVGLPYVEVLRKTGQHLTSSREEAHRLNGAWLRKSALQQEGTDWIPYVNERLGLQTHTPLVWSRIYPALYDLDPFCLLHGLFLADEKFLGQPKVARALTATMDAYGVSEVVSGGVKKDTVVAKNVDTGGSQEGFGFIPFSRTEYVADCIESRFVLDLAQLRSYGLDPVQTETLYLLGLWEIRAMASRPQRLRTFCDLQATEVSLMGMPGQLPGLDELEVLAADRVPPASPDPLRLVYKG